MLIEWKDKYQTGAEVDHEHRELVALINRLPPGLELSRCRRRRFLRRPLRTISSHFALEGARCAKPPTPATATTRMITNGCSTICATSMDRGKRHRARHGPTSSHRPHRTPGSRFILRHSMRASAVPRAALKPGCNRSGVGRGQLSPFYFDPSALNCLMKAQISLTSSSSLGPGKRHLGAGDHAFGVADVFLEAFLVPGDAGILVGVSGVGSFVSTRLSSRRCR